MYYRRKASDSDADQKTEELKKQIIKETGADPELVGYLFSEKFRRYAEPAARAASDAPQIQTKPEYGRDAASTDGHVLRYDPAPVSVLRVGYSFDNAVLADIGYPVHEYLHVKYTDTEIMGAVRNPGGKPKFPVRDSRRLAKLNEIRRRVTEMKPTAFECQVLGDLFNIAEDGRIERIGSAKSEYAAEALRLLNEALFDDGGTEGTLKSSGGKKKKQEKKAPEKISSLDFIRSRMLNICIAHLPEDALPEVPEDIKEDTDKAVGIMERAVRCADSYSAELATEVIFKVLRRYIAEAEKTAKEESERRMNSPQKGEMPQIDSAPQENGAESIPGTIIEFSPDGSDRTSDAQGGTAGDGKDGKDSGGSGNTPQEQVHAGTAQSLKEFRDNCRQDEAGSRETASFMADMKDECTGNDAGVHITVDAKFTEKNREEYCATAARYAGVTNEFVRRILTMRSNRQEKTVYTTRGKLAQNKLYKVRFSPRTYSRKVLPDRPDDMCVVILVDLSGSMCGEKCDNAEAACTVLCEAFRKLKIPVAVVGHDASYPEFRLAWFKRFSCDEDRFSVPSMNPGGCNRDGLALKLAAKIAKKRPEKNKVLLSITDGYPSDSGYGGDSARTDMLQIGRRLKNEGVNLIGIAVSEDEDENSVISSCYKESMGVTDVTQLPMKLLGLFTKFL